MSENTEVNNKKKTLKMEKKRKRKEVKTVEEKTAPSRPQDTKPKKRKRETQDGNQTPSKKAKSKKKDKKEKSKKDENANDAKELEIDVNLPAPPSKKALRLQKKGRPAPAGPTTLQPPDSTEKPGKVDDDVHPARQKLIRKEPQRAEFSVWIGNLSYSTDVKGLRNWLTHGLASVEESEITRVYLPVNASGQSKGYHPSSNISIMSGVDSRFAYVDLKSELGIERIISRSEQVLDGRRLLIKNGKDFTGRPTEKKQRYHAQHTNPSQSPKTIAKKGPGPNKFVRKGPREIGGPQGDKGKKAKEES